MPTNSVPSHDRRTTVDLLETPLYYFAAGWVVTEIAIVAKRVDPGVSRELEVHSAHEACSLEYDLRAAAELFQRAREQTQTEASRGWRCHGRSTRLRRGSIRLRDRSAALTYDSY